MKSNGLVTSYSFSVPSSTKRRSATNSMYCDIKSEFMPMRRTGNDSQINSQESPSPKSNILHSRLYLFGFPFLVAIRVFYEGSVNGIDSLHSSITITASTDASKKGGGFVVGSHYGSYEFRDIGKCILTCKRPTRW